MIRKRSFVGVGLLAVALLLAATTAMAGGPATRGPIQSKHRTGRDSVTSGNWAGYVAYGTTFSAVTGTWQVPAATCNTAKKFQHKVTIASAWVGLDGYKSNTVEQTGTDSDCLGGSQAYFAWYEFYPAGPVFASTNYPSSNYPIAAGDNMRAYVTVSGGQVSTTLEDWGSNTPGTGSPEWTYPASSNAISKTGLALNSAEWILEKPSHLLTNFGSVDFSSATATDTTPTTNPIDSWTYDKITMTTNPGPHGTALATPGDITDSVSPRVGTSSFTISP